MRTTAAVSPLVRARLDALSPELRSAILARNVPLRTLNDLIRVLDDVIREAEGH